MLHHHKSSKIIDKWAVVSICMLNNQRVMPSIIILFGSVPRWDRYDFSLPRRNFRICKMPYPWNKTVLLCNRLYSDIVWLKQIFLKKSSRAKLWENQLTMHLGEHLLWHCRLLNQASGVSKDTSSAALDLLLASTWCMERPQWRCFYSQSIHQNWCNHVWLWPTAHANYAVCIYIILVIYNTLYILYVYIIKI